MADPTYGRGFLAGLEYGRMLAISCFVAQNGRARELRDLIDASMLAALVEAEEDARALRRRIIALHSQALEIYAAAEPRNRPPAELVNLAAWRDTPQAKQRRRSGQDTTPAAEGRVTPLLRLVPNPETPSRGPPQQAPQPRGETTVQECVPA